MNTFGSINISFCLPQQAKQGIPPSMHAEAWLNRCQSSKTKRRRHLREAIVYYLHVQSTKPINNVH